MTSASVEGLTTGNDTDYVAFDESAGGQTIRYCVLLRTSLEMRASLVVVSKVDYRLSDAL